MSADSDIQEVHDARLEAEAIENVAYRSRTHQGHGEEAKPVARRSRPIDQSQNHQGDQRKDEEEQAGLRTDVDSERRPRVVRVGQPEELSQHRNRVAERQGVHGPHLGEEIQPHHGPHDAGQERLLVQSGRQSSRLRQGAGVSERHLSLPSPCT